MSHYPPFKFNPSRNIPRVRYWEATLIVKKDQMENFLRQAAAWRVRFLKLYGWTLVSATYAETGRVNEVKHLWRIPYWSVNAEIMLDHALGMLAKDYSIIDYTVTETVQNYRVGMSYDPGVLAAHASLYVRAKMYDGIGDLKTVVHGGNTKETYVIEIPVTTLYENREWLAVGPYDSYYENQESYKIIADELSYGTDWIQLELDRKRWDGDKLVGSEATPSKGKYIILNLSNFSEISPYQTVDPYDTTLMLPTEEMLEAMRSSLNSGKKDYPLTNIRQILHPDIDGICLALPNDDHVFWLDRRQLEYAGKVASIAENAREKNFPNEEILSRINNFVSEIGALGSDKKEQQRSATDLVKKFAPFVRKALLPYSQESSSGRIYFIKEDSWENERSYVKLKKILNAGKPDVGTVVGEALGFWGVGQVCWAADLTIIADPHREVNALDAKLEQLARDKGMSELPDISWPTKNQSYPELRRLHSRLANFLNQLDNPKSRT